MGAIMSGTTTCRVLFVEDEAIVSMLIEDMLLDLGVKVVGPASKLDEALALARHADVEAAVLDINVGGQLTYSVAEVLQARGIPVIFSTGYGASALPERFRDTLTLHKPFDRSSFEQALRTALATSPCDIAAA
jgi:CheY-like chemotaxis protein